MNNMEMDFLWVMALFHSWKIKWSWVNIYSDGFIIYVVLLVSLKELLNNTFVTCRTNTDLDLLAFF